MKLKLLALLLVPSIVLASPTSTTTYVEGGEGIVNRFTRLHSHHHYHIQNLTGMKQIYQMTMTLCAADKGKNGECEIVKTRLGLEHGQEINWDKDVYHDTVYQQVASHSVTASTQIANMPEVTTSDQKYIWIHY